MKDGEFEIAFGCVHVLTTNPCRLDDIRQLALGKLDVPLFITTEGVGICTLRDLGLKKEVRVAIKRAAIAAGMDLPSPGPDVAMQDHPDANGNDPPTTDAASQASDVDMLDATDETGANGQNQ